MKHRHISFSTTKVSCNQVLVDLSKTWRILYNTSFYMLYCIFCLFLCTACKFCSPMHSWNLYVPAYISFSLVISVLRSESRGCAVRRLHVFISWIYRCDRLSFCFSGERYGWHRSGADIAALAQDVQWVLQSTTEWGEGGGAQVRSCFAPLLQGLFYKLWLHFIKRCRHGSASSRRLQNANSIATLHSTPLT